MEFLHPENRKVLAFYRRYQEETILVIANLSRFPQHVELDLSEVKGMTPVEIFGRAEFPPIGDQPYIITLAALSFYWLSLETKRVRQESVNTDSEKQALPEVTVDSLEEVFQGRSLLVLLRMLPEFGLAGFENQYPHQLSGGMRQRVALMRTFLFERDLMLLDEPFGALDALTRAMMQRWLLDVWQKYRRTILFITHDVDEAIFLGDRVLVMTARPGSVKLEQVIDLPRPRRPEIVTSPEFVRLKRTLLDAIEEESMKSFQSTIAQEKAS